ncbi:YqeG family HAD IIIA-type phosphatase [Anaerotignum sp. MB30-C6]|uniref:YqeG family HAD IIIA-type phosphatase n=1 Tax=Anaerotignum sp. MB30-C6 TaxID=3070814 RepID=UPI0027DDCBD6|nr:YqeG family HAD IIIA-type phosphatase [Anaerotignum sp. MB30-C6]WMI81386.1 YqeG family HAD IIIA-type phosphatase [Anaerotignum sp. MB30-C6]
MILERFFPDIYVKSVYELPIEKLKAMGIKGLVFDIDNTVAPFDIAEPDDDLMELFLYLKKQGFRICILSNNNRKRVQLFNKNLKTLAVHKAGKPGVRKLKLALKKLKLSPKHTAIIGDQIFTDMWCGHKAGLICILTAPICDRDQLVTKVKRGLEKQVLKVYFKREGK